MRPSLLVPTLLICALKIPFGKADDLDPTPWRSYSDPEHAQGYEDSARHARTITLSLRHPAIYRAFHRRGEHERDADGSTARVIARAHELIGEPYRWGSESLATGFDCSGLLVYLFRSEANLQLPRTTASMIRQRQLAVARAELQPGDAVFFNRNGSGNTRHVGLYIGNRRFIHAPRTGQTIRIDSLDNLYWQRSYTTARRFSG